MADLKMAIGWMNEGKRVRRAKWSEGAVIHKEKETFFFNKEDYKAIDWEVYEETFCLQKLFDTSIPHGYHQEDVREFINRVKAEVSKEFDGSPASVIHKIIERFASLGAAE